MTEKNDSHVTRKAVVDVLEGRSRGVSSAGLSGKSTSYSPWSTR